MLKKFRTDRLGRMFISLDTWASALAEKRKVKPPSGSEVLDGIVFELLSRNHELWLHEDFARRRDVAAAEIAETKHAIDSLNQRRNDTIERIDEWLLEHHYGAMAEKNLPLRTETPGSALDRLSILSLKIYYMSEQTKRTDVDDAHRAECRARLRVLKRQQKNLREALKQVLSDLNRGVIRMIVYRQFKMYNDPALNPQLYDKKARGNSRPKNNG
ncbi:MAG TPA: DUF4254 domain-containing protein [Bacteroidota bacterium]|nr:DUF4254 domain-containing protein [Bacteroidota bacterium]